MSVPILPDGAYRADFTGAFDDEYARPPLVIKIVPGKFTLGVAIGFGHRGGWSGKAAAFEVDPTTTTVEQLIKKIKRKLSTEGAYLTASSFGLGVEELPKLISNSPKAMAMNGTYVDIWNGACD